MRGILRILLLLTILAATILAHAQEVTNTTSENVTVSIPKINVTSKAAIQLNAYIDQKGVAHFIYICEYMASKDDCVPLSLTVKDNATGTTLATLVVGPGSCQAGICRDTKSVSLKGDTFMVEVGANSKTYRFILRKDLGPSLESRLPLAQVVMTLLPFAIVVAFAVRGTITEAGAGMVAGGVFALLSRYIGADPMVSITLGVLMIILGLLIIALLR